MIDIHPQMPKNIIKAIYSLVITVGLGWKCGGTNKNSSCWLLNFLLDNVYRELKSSEEERGVHL